MILHLALHSGMICLARDRRSSAAGAPQVIGATELLARYPMTTPYTPQNVLATLYHVMGIDPETTMIHDLEGRPMHLLDDRKPVKELL